MGERKTCDIRGIPPHLTPRGLVKNPRAKGTHSPFASIFTRSRCGRCVRCAPHTHHQGHALGICARDPCQRPAAGTMAIHDNLLVVVVLLLPPCPCPLGDQCGRGASAPLTLDNSLGERTFPTSKYVPHAA